MELTPLMQKVLNDFYQESCKNHQRIEILKTMIEDIESSNLTMLGVVRGILLSKKTAKNEIDSKLKLIMEEFQ